MRWNALFDDIEAQVLDEQARERLAEVADRTRRERAARTLLDRLATDWSGVEVLVRSNRLIAGSVSQVGSDWFALDGPDRREWLVPAAAVIQLTPLAARTDPGGPTALRRFALGYALRALSRGRGAVLVDDALGRTVTGTVEAVGADIIELVQHAIDVPPRIGTVGARRILPVTAIACVAGALPTGSRRP